MVQLRCPACRGEHWVIDSDHRGINGPDVEFRKRVYGCRICGEYHAGHKVLRKSPDGFLIGARMSAREFARWDAIRREHFPEQKILEPLQPTENRRPWWKFWATPER